MADVLITGAGKGLGYELSRQYAAEGLDVVAVVQWPEELARLRALCANVRVFVADVTDPAGLARLAHDLAGEAIELLICNAGLFGPAGQPFGQTDFAAWERVLRVNVIGTAATIEALAENVAASRRKLVIAISSRLGSIALNDGGDPIYRSSKAALNQVVRTLSIDLARRGLIVVAISPGWVRTEMGGPDAPLAPEDSIAKVRRVVAKLTCADTGRFIAHDGTENPW